MIGLIVRLTILFGVVIGVAYAATRRIKDGRDKKRLEGLERDILALKADNEAGVFTPSERRDIIEAADNEVRALNGEGE